MPAVTSAEWVISFKRDSVTDQRTFTISMPNTTPKSVVDGVASALRKLDFEVQAVTFRVVLP